MRIQTAVSLSYTIIIILCRRGQSRFFRRQSRVRRTSKVDYGQPTADVIKKSQETSFIKNLTILVAGEQTSNGLLLCSVLRKSFPKRVRRRHSLSMGIFFTKTQLTISVCEQNSFHRYNIILMNALCSYYWCSSYSLLFS